MAQPTPYNRQADLTDYAASHTSAPYNAALHDSEFDAIEQTLDGVCENLALIQRDDGKIRNQSVHPDSLDGATLALIASNLRPRGAWVTATSYAVGDLVEQSSFSYVCAVAHTSGVFATDRAASRWVILGGNSTPAAIDIPFTPTGALVATNTQAALAELDADLTAHAHISNSSAHAATNITYAGGPTIPAGGSVEAALDWLDTNKARVAAPTFTGSVTFSFSGDVIGSFGVSGYTTNGSGGFGTGYLIYQYGNVSANGFTQFRARGSFASILDSQAGDLLNGLVGYGWNQSTWRLGARIDFEQESYSAGVGYVQGTIRFFTTNSSGALAEGLRIYSSGAIATAGEAPPSGYTSRGDIALPATGKIRSLNTAKAWVHFDGTVPPASMIKSAFNVASIADNGGGDYTINFSVAMANANYCAVGTAGFKSGAGFLTFRGPVNTTPTTTQYRCRVSDATPNFLDADHISIAFFGD